MTLKWNTSLGCSFWAQSGWDWPQMWQIRNFFRSDFSNLWFEPLWCQNWDPWPVTLYVSVSRLACQNLNTPEIWPLTCFIIAPTTRHYLYQLAILRWARKTAPCYKRKDNSAYQWLSALVKPDSLSSSENAVIFAISKQWFCLKFKIPGYKQGVMNIHRVSSTHGSRERVGVYKCSIMHDAGPGLTVQPNQ